MKRQISISILLSLLTIILTMVYIKVNNETKPNEYEIATESNDKNVVEIISPKSTYLFYAKEKDGRLVIYHANTSEIYFESSIEVYTLPTEIIEKLDDGIYFETEKDLYDFLESYSS